MPAFAGKISDQDLAAVTSYVRESWRNRLGDVSPQTVATDRQLAGAIMTSGKPLVYAQIYYAWDLMRQIGLLCPKESPRQRTASVIPLKSKVSGS